MTKLARNVVLFMVLSIVEVSSIYAADIYRKSQESNLIYLEGEIVRGDFEKLEKELASTPGPGPDVTAEIMGHEVKRPEWMTRVGIDVDSRGGDAAEAIRMGRLLRQARAAVWMSGSDAGEIKFIHRSDGGVIATSEGEAECFSACVYLLAAGLVRDTRLVGIHRPYTTVTPGQNTDYTLKALLQESREYFEEMNIPARLADDMFSIRPEDIKLLTHDEIASYRLDQNDFAYDDRMQHWTASLFGMTRSEYVQKLAAMRQDTDANCYSIEAIKQNKDLNFLSECVDKYKRKHGLYFKD